MTMKAMRLKLSMRTCSLRFGAADWHSMQNKLTVVVVEEGLDLPTKSPRAVHLSVIKVTELNHCRYDEVLIQANQ